MATNKDFIVKNGLSVGGDVAITGNVTSDLHLNDNAKIKVGTATDGDLQIYHNVNNSFIEDVGTGSLYLRADASVRIQSYGDNNDMIKADKAGAVTLYHNNGSRLDTTASGVNVTGTVDMDGFTSVGNGTITGDVLIQKGSGFPRITLQDLDGTNTRAFIQYSANTLHLTSQNNTANGRIVFSRYDGTTTTTSGYFDATGKLFTSSDLDVSGNVVSSGNISAVNTTLTGYLRGPASFTIDPAAHGDDTGTVIIAGNLQVDGTQTTINSTSLTVDDLNLTLASGAADSAAANGAGITIDGASASLTYAHSGTKFVFNKPLDVTGNIGVTGTVDGVDIQTLNTTAGAALPKAGGTMTGALNMGNQNLINAGTIGAGAGTVSLPSLSFAGDPNTGLYSPSADNLGFAIGGTARAFMSNTQFNVDAKIVATELDINGAGDVSGNLTAGALFSNAGLRNAGGSDFGSQQSFWAGGSGTTHQAGYTIGWNTGGNSARTQKMVLDNNGNLLINNTLSVGIASTLKGYFYEDTLDQNGNAKPTSVVGVAAATNSVGEGPTIDFSSIWAQGTVYQQDNWNEGWTIGRIGAVYDNQVSNGGALVFYTHSGTTASGGANNAEVSEKMRIRPNGNVGIGTNGPKVSLHVAGGGYFTAFENPTGSGVAGMELGYDGSQSVIQSYDRANSAYKPIRLNGSSTTITNTLDVGALTIPTQGMIFNQAFGTGVPSITMTGTANNGRGGAINFKESDGSGGAIADTAAIYSTDGLGSNGSYGGLTLAAYQSDIRFSTGTLAGTKMIVQAGGNVGIGTAAPVASTNKTVLAVQGVWGGVVDIMVGTAVHASFGTDNFASGQQARIQSGSGIVFKSGGTTERMRIDGTGNTQIGAPISSHIGGNKFFVNKAVNAAPVTSGTTQTGGALRLRGGDNAVLDMGMNSVNTWIQATDRANLANGYTIALNPNGGNVGIGINAPAVPLHVRKVAGLNTTVELLRLDCGDTTHVGGKAGTIKFTDISVYNPTAEITAARVGVTSSSFLKFDLRSSEIMRMESGGDMIYGGSTGVHEKYFSGVTTGNATFSHDITHTADNGTGTVLKIMAAFTHHPSYDCMLESWVSRRDAAFTQYEQFRRNTSTSGSWALSRVSSTVTRVTKVAGTYGGGGPYWIKAVWRNY